MSTAIRVRLPRPYPTQSEIIRHPAKRKIICAGRRAGKTTLAALVAVLMLLKGRRVLLTSPSQQQADTFWRYVKKWLRFAIAAGAILKQETTRTVELANGKGLIRVKTASDPDMLRGDYYDFVVLDECALLSPEAWFDVIAPMLIDTDGTCWFISTPRRRNWFFRLYQRGIDDSEAGRTRWHSWNFASALNPHLSQEALAELAEELTDDSFQQEILAQFLEGEGSVFRKIQANLYKPLDRPKDGPAIGSRPDEHRGHHLVMGLDWARQNDYTAASVFCLTCMVEVAIDRFNRVDWEMQRGRVKAIWEQWRVREIFAESNSIGGPNIEALQSEGLPVVPFETTTVTKPQIVRAFALALEREQAKWLDVPSATGELEAYEGIESKRTGYIHYTAPEGMHDDTVMARMIAWRAALSGGPAMDADIAAMMART